MDSIRKIFRTGMGPSSSHTMGPKRAATAFAGRQPAAVSFRVTLFGSLAATGKGHMTDRAIAEALSPRPVEILWRPDEALPFHPNGMRFEALDPSGAVTAAWQAYSVGGGSVRDEEHSKPIAEVYKLKRMDHILKWTVEEGKSFWEYVDRCEGQRIWEHLAAVWRAMQACVRRGLDQEGVLPGGLGVPRKASAYHMRSRNQAGFLKQTATIFAYALAVAEENAAGGEVVTAPTCGSCGILPAVLLFLQETYALPEIKILRALATAGLVGNLVKQNASISGAEVGCQGEVGTASSMAAAAVTQCLGGTPAQIEYAAEMGLEHHLGLTCDPVGGLVQIPCIERNAMAALRAIEAAAYAVLSDGRHRVSFDQVVDVMKQTGRDLQSRYRETACGGLALRMAPKIEPA